MRTTLPLGSILAARNRIRTYLDPTPLIHSAALSEIFNAGIWLKLENQQPTGSFKVRGAINKLWQLEREVQPKGVVTGSAGNHGLGVAFAALSLGIQPVTIVVPTTAPEPKKARLHRFELDLIEQGETYEQAHQAGLELAAKHRWTYIEAYDDVDVIAGQGTIGLEIMDDLPDVDVVVVPVGGGGLIAGIASAVKQMKPSCQIIGVQAAASPAAQLSLLEGQPYDPYDHEPTIADGLSGGFGKVPFFLARMLIDRIELASELQLREAVYSLLKEELILAEPSGAISAHPLVKRGEDWSERKVVCVISGGNLSISLLKQIMNDMESD
jgi:threonine dehydratase